MPFVIYTNDGKRYTMDNNARSGFLVAIAIAAAHFKWTNHSDCLVTAWGPDGPVKLHGSDIRHTCIEQPDKGVSG